MRDSNGILIPESLIYNIKKDIMSKYPSVPFENLVHITNITISDNKYKIEYVIMGMSNYSYHEVDIKLITRSSKLDDLGI